MNNNTQSRQRSFLVIGKGTTGLYEDVVRALRISHEKPETGGMRGRFRRIELVAVDGDNRHPRNEGTELDSVWERAL